MALRVLDFDGRTIQIAAPLAPNRNHHGTAFGGSLATLGIVTGWALVDAALRNAGLPSRVVVQHSDCEFIAPVNTGFVATASLPDHWPRFVATLQKHRRVRVEIATMIATGGAPLVQHLGRYAAFLDAANHEPT